MVQALRPLKRSKETSGAVDVSPNTLCEMPSVQDTKEAPFYKYIKLLEKVIALKSDHAKRDLTNCNV